MNFTKIRSWPLGLMFAAAIEVSCFGASAHAAIILSEPFNTNSSSANMAANYPNYTVSSGASVVGQELILNSADLTTTASYSGPKVIQFDINSVTAPNVGNTKVILQLGSGINANSVLYHPEYSGGALRVDSVNSTGFGNQTMPFTPTIGTDYHMKVEDSGTGNFSVTLTNNSNPLETYYKTWTNTALSTSSYTIGLTYALGVGEFDNLTVTAVPEPSTYALLAVGSSVAILLRRRRSIEG